MWHPATSRELAQLVWGTRTPHRRRERPGERGRPRAGGIDAGSQGRGRTSAPLTRTWHRWRILEGLKQASTAVAAAVTAAPVAAGEVDDVAVPAGEVDDVNHAHGRFGGFDRAASSSCARRRTAIRTPAPAPLLAAPPGGGSPRPRVPPEPFLGLLPALLAQLRARLAARPRHRRLAGAPEPPARRRDKHAAAPLARASKPSAESSPSKSSMGRPSSTACSRLPGSPRPAGALRGGGRAGEYRVFVAALLAGVVRVPAARGPQRRRRLAEGAAPALELMRAAADVAPALLRVLRGEHSAPAARVGEVHQRALARLPPCCSESASASKSKVGCEALASRPPKRVKKVHSRDASVGSPPGRDCSLERAEAPARAMRTWHAAMSVSTYEDMPPLKASLSPRARRKALSASTSGASSGSSRCMASTAPTASKPLVEPTDTSAAMPFRNTSLMMGTRALDITCALDTSPPERKRLASLWESGSGACGWDGAGAWIRGSEKGGCQRAGGGSRAQ